MSPAKHSPFSKKIVIIASIIAAVLIGWIIIAVLTNQHNGANSQTNANKKADTPQFSTIAPKGKSIDSLGGWTRISPPNNDPVFAYNDKINEVSINVSEQPLPKSFKDDVDAHVAQAAKGFNATDPLTAGDTKAFIGTSAKGPQFVIFAKKELFVLIKSQEKIDTADWVNYIKNLN